MEFKDLKMRPHPILPNVFQAVHMFDNGHFVSVISLPYFNGRVVRYEILLITGDENPISGLTEEGVTRRLKIIELMDQPPRKG